MKKWFLRSIYLLIALLAAIGEFFLITLFAPDAAFQLSIVKLPVEVVFFLLLFIFFFFGIMFLCDSKLQGVLLGGFICIYMLFRFSGLTKPLYQILLMLIFLSAELFFHQKKKEKRER